MADGLSLFSDVETKFARDAGTVISRENDKRLLPQAAFVDGYHEFTDQLVHVIDIGREELLFRAGRFVAVCGIGTKRSVR